MKFTQDWFERAACRGKAVENQSSDLFFCDEQDPATVKEAQKLCWSCQARLDCLDYALSLGIPDGIWGGLTAGDRRRFRRPRMYTGLTPDLNDVADAL